jgi:hypothetical protein
MKMRKRSSLENYIRLTISVTLIASNCRHHRRALAHGSSAQKSNLLKVLTAFIILIFMVNVIRTGAGHSIRICICIGIGSRGWNGPFDDSSSFQIWICSACASAAIIAIDIILAISVLEEFHVDCFYT